MRKEYLIAFAILVLAIAISYIATIKTVNNSVSQASKDTAGSIAYHSMVYISLNGKEIYKSPNIVVDSGLNYIKQCTGRGQCGSAAAGNFSYIALGNITSGGQDTTDTSLANEWASCGLTRGAGVYTDIGTGNWSLSKVWTATGACLVNTTGLFNATSGDTMFAENNFTTVSLQANDQINVTWTIWVTSSG